MKNDEGNTGDPFLVIIDMAMEIVDLKTEIDMLRARLKSKDPDLTAEPTKDHSNQENKAEPFYMDDQRLTELYFFIQQCDRFNELDQNEVLYAIQHLYENNWDADKAAKAYYSISSNIIQMNPKMEP